jgi:hypothetical protein
MTMLGLDYAGGRPSGAAIRAAGYSFVVRYLTDGGPNLPGKLLTPTEYRDLQSNAVAVVVNWETTADRMRAGRAAGIADAQSADTTARSVGHPEDRPVYFSCDFDATANDQLVIDEYLRGAATIIGPSRVGIYGGYWPVSRALNNGTAAWAWQTGAWSGGNVGPRIHIYQRIGTVIVGGVECDVNEARQPDFGQHPQPQVRRSENMIMNYPIHGQNNLRLVCPVGSASSITARAWISAIINGPQSGAHVDVWFQADTTGISDAHWDLNFTDGRSDRCWTEIPDGTTQINIEHKLPDDGAICLETLAK